MKPTETCQGSSQCSGSCELASWCQPKPLTAYEKALEAILHLGDWLPVEPRSTQEIAAAIFQFIPYAGENPRDLEFFQSLPEALFDAGYTAHGYSSDDLTWCCPEQEPRKGKDSISSATQIKPACLQNEFTPVKPFGIRITIDLMVMLNARWLRSEYFKTSRIAREFFPNACKEAMDSWLLKVIDESLWDIGYSPEGEEDDPIWFCDGDVRCLKYGSASLPCADGSIQRAS
jgi:hypothetical protein